MPQPYLILVLQAPLIAYGNEAVDRIRPTDTIPGRSMLAGLLGNALGYHRREVEKLTNLQHRIRYAARAEQITSREQTNPTIRDFHTVQLSKEDRAWTTYGIPEKRTGDSYQAPEIRQVHYLVEHRTVAAITLSDAAGNPGLAELAQAVRKPARPLFIGRKCCLPERPVFETIIQAESDTEALSMIPGTVDSPLPALIQWDETESHCSVNKTHDLWVSDLKDWRNGVHVGRRLVNRGVQSLLPPTPNPTGEPE